MPFNWLESMAIGNGTIDKQHRQLIKMINDLMEACNDNRSSSELEHALHFLMDYFLRHFEAEEKIQQKNRYPLYEEHKKIHDAFKVTINGIVSDFQKEGPTISVLNALEFEVGKWIIDHICEQDKKIGEFLRSKTES